MTDDADKKTARPRSGKKGSQSITSADIDPARARAQEKRDADDAVREEEMVAAQAAANVMRDACGEVTKQTGWHAELVGGGVVCSKNGFGSVTFFRSTVAQAAVAAIAHLNDEYFVPRPLKPRKPARGADELAG
jgi:hypothetical protein